MTLFEEDILKTIQEVYRRTLNPVRTMSLAVHLDAYDRTLRLHLVKMEQRGVVQRKGQRGGWLPAKVA